eukprot:484457-Hanusia_phi.AAC.1
MQQRRSMRSAGDAGVGKSAIVQMFHSKGSHYPRQYNMTTGCDFVMKEMKVPESDYTVELHIYDCAGQSVFKELTSQYWKNSNIVIFVYDVTKPESFESLGEWLDLVRKKCPEKVLPGVVVANKVDLEDRAKVATVHTTEGAEFARNNSLEFCQVSAYREINGHSVRHLSRDSQDLSASQLHARLLLRRHTLACSPVSLPLPRTSLPPTRVKQGLKVIVGRLGPVSYTHLRAHETVLDL